MAARAFSFVEIALVSGVINTAINAPIGWLVVKPGATLPLWGVPSIALDFCVMAFAIAFGTALVVTPQTRWQVATGRLLPPALSPSLHAALARWPRSLFQRAVNLGVLGGLLFVPLPLFVLWVSDVPAADRVVFTLLKGSFSFVEGALVTPLIAAAATVKQ